MLRAGVPLHTIENHYSLQNEFDAEMLQGRRLGLPAIEDPLIPLNEILISNPSDYISRPCPDLIDGPRSDYISIGLPLYEASIKGDWETAKEIFDKRRELVRYSITENGETALHVAASAESTGQVEEFFEHLVKYMDKKDLEIQDNSSNTALCIVAAAGNVRMVKSLVEKNKVLILIPGNKGMMPLYIAVLFRNYEVVKYLYDNSQKLRDDGWTTVNRGWLLQKCVEFDMFDIALQIVKDHPKVASPGEVLGLLARKPDALSKRKSGVIINMVFKFICLKVGAPEKETEALQLLRIILRNIAELPRKDVNKIIRGPPDPPIKKDDKPASDKEDQTLQLLKQISDEIRNIIKEPPAAIRGYPNVASHANARKKYSSRVLFFAAEVGNTRFIIELIHEFPDLIWKLNDNNQSIFHTAAQHRHKDIYNLLYEIGSKKDQIALLKDAHDNNMLHLIGKIPKKKPLEQVSGAAFEMQQELLWFKEVEKMVPLAYREERNRDGLTPHELFTKEHKDLVSKGEEWMKGTASQCMVVAALIATIVFAAAFTVPGGYNQNDGIPIFYRKVTFMVFVVADAISLFSSSASIIMFLSILTSRYAERDFYESLPKKLFLGLSTLLLSITTMMITFSVSFFILYHKDLKWIPILVSLFSAMPVFLFATLQYPLLKDVFRSTYSSRYLFRPKKRALYEKRALPFISRCTSKILKLL